MSLFTGYSLSKNNIYNLTDKELFYYFYACQNTKCGLNYYFNIIPKTTDQVNDINYQMNICVLIASLYFEELLYEVECSTK